MKNFSSAPLPFQGQKRRWCKAFKSVLSGFYGKVYVDLFGGSGLLSHLSKQVNPNAKVVWNDYDDYHVRLSNVSKTNALLADLRSMLVDVSRKDKLSEALKRKVLDRVAREPWVDWVTLSGSLLFSMNYAFDIKGFEAQALYNKVKCTDYEVDGYLEGVEVVKSNYLELFKQYKDVEGVVFLIDPPYLSTDVSSYMMSSWGLGDYLNVLDTLDSNYIYFTSNKSSIIELSEWLEAKYGVGNPFAGATKIEVKTQASFGACYVDIMMHKRRC